jgi:hypothetical protein
MSEREEPVHYRHVPAIAERKDGTWGVFCHECSRTLEEYTYPCVLGWWKQSPPPILQNPVETPQYAKIIRSNQELASSLHVIVRTNYDDIGDIPERAEAVRLLKEMGRDV